MAEEENNKKSKEENNKKNTDIAEITDLPPKIQRFVHMHMTGQYTVTKLAELLEVHPNTVHRWLNRRDVKEVIADMQETTHEVVGTQIKALTTKAVNRLNDLVDSPVDGVALQAVNTILDRGGHKTKNEIKVDKTVRSYEEKLNDVIDTTLDELEPEELEVVNKIDGGDDGDDGNE